MLNEIIKNLTLEIKHYFLVGEHLVFIKICKDNSLSYDYCSKLTQLYAALIINNKE